jgi:uncharacterized protein with NAD-binding domain and iron-sulfur cluster
MLYDYIIIGGGISGLYTYYQLLKKNPSLNILLFEKNNYFGGRIKTKYIKKNGISYQMEEGAGRFNKNHTLLIQLIDELNLSKDIIKIDGASTFIDTTHEFPEKKYQNIDSFYFIDKVLQYASKEPNEFLKKYSFSEYAFMKLPKKDVDFMIQSSGYYSRVLSMNVYNAYDTFKNNIRNDIDYFILKNGLTSIIKNLLSFIRNKKKHLFLQSELNSVTYHKENKYFDVLINQKNLFQTKKIIFAVPKSTLLTIPYFQKYVSLLNSISCVPLCRVYAIYNQGWFKNIGKTTTNNLLKYIIPMNKNTGLIMISYTNGKFAEYWKKYLSDKDNLNNKLNNKLNNTLKKNVKEVFDKNTENPNYTNICFWKDGMNYWKPKKNSKILSKKIMHLDKNIPLYIIGEAYSQNQGWMEGALESSSIFLNNLENN